MYDDPMQRVFHREMYIDLIRAYLQDDGTESDLARALGISLAALSYWLAPFRPRGRKRRGSISADAVEEDPRVLQAYLLAVRTPPLARAIAIAAQLCTDAERRDVLLYHIAMARRSAPRGDTGPAGESVDLDRELRAIGDVHSIALATGTPGRTRIAYEEVWHSSLALIPLVHAKSHPLERAQVLMFLNDAASVLDRPDLALAHAREATMILTRTSTDLDEPMRERMRINALLAEVVTLNNLGLSADAVEGANHALTLPGAGSEPRAWRRSFLEQKLKGLSRQSRFQIGEAAELADRARECAGDDVDLLLGIDAYLIAAYTAAAHHSPRSARRAEALVEDLRMGVAAARELNPLRKVRFLRAAAALYHLRRDWRERDEMLRQARWIIDIAGLEHQRAELARAYGTSVWRGFQ